MEKEKIDKKGVKVKHTSLSKNEAFLITLILQLTIFMIKSKIYQLHFRLQPCYRLFILYSSYAMYRCIIFGQIIGALSDLVTFTKLYLHVLKI